MKKIQYILTSLAALSLLFACSPERLEENASLNGRALVFTASTVGDTPTTKTELKDGGPEVWWSVGDAINVFQGTTGSRFVSTNREPALQAEFQGYLPVVTGTSSGFWAVYPYAAENVPNGTGVVAKVPADQKAMGGTFDPSALLTVAYTEDLTLAFQNVCGGLKFQVTQDWIQQVELRSNDGAPLAGKVTVALDASGHPVVTDIQDASEAVRLTMPYGETFQPGTWYYLVCLPAALTEGYTLTFRSETQTGVKLRGEEVEVERSAWGRLSAADAGVVPEEEPNSIFDNVIYYTTTDGEVIEPQNTRSFGADLVSNTYENGRGVMVFDGPVTIIPYGAFERCSTLSSIRLPATVRTIGEFSFDNCSSLVSILMGRNVREIGQAAFQGCSSLEAITFPEELEIINPWTFNSCSSLGDIVLPDGLISIGEYAFQSCYFSEVTVPGSLQVVEPCAFAFCDNLSAFHGPLATSDGRGLVIDGTLVAFARGDMEYPVDYEVEAGISGLGEKVFENVWQFREVTLPDSIVQIGEGAFVNCGITAFHGAFASKDGRFLIQDNTLKAVAFGNYQSFELPEGITRIGGCAFYNSWIVSSLVIPEGITEIGASAFEFCYNLTDVSLPTTLLSIGTHAFRSCRNEAFTAFTIPASVTTLGHEILNDCINLQSITVLPTTPPSFTEYYWYPLGSGLDNATIYVPAASLEVYQTTNGWNHQSNYQAIPE